MRTSILPVLLGVIAYCSVTAQAGTIEVSQPVQVTSDSHYERGQSIIYDGANYWLFYGRSASVTGNYQNSDPDVNDYAVYWKTSLTVVGLASAVAEAIPGATNSYRGETGAVYFGDEVWAFATIVSGATADLNGWYYDGSAWNQVSPIVSGLSSDAAHHDEIEFNGELFVVVRRANFHTTHSATPKIGGWSAEVQVNTGTDAGGGLCRFFKHGSSLYLAVFRSDAPATNMIFQYDSGTDSWTKVAETPSGGGDPALFRAGGMYVFAQAPWVSSPDGGQRYIMAWSNTALASIFDGPSKMVSQASYATNTWTAMWPTGFTDDDGSYLFYTSERADPGQEGTGNIWYLKVEWNLDNGHYTYIQNAIGAAGPGDTVNVAAATYHNDVYTLSKTVVLRGANADVDPAGATDRGGETTLTRDDANVFSIVPGATGTVINGIRFGNSSAQSGSEIYIDDATDVSIRYSIFYNSSGYGVAVGPTAHRAEVLYNAVSSSAGEGLVNLGASDVVISGNVIRNVSTFAIRTSGKATLSGNTVSQCRDGIRVEYVGTGPGDRVEVVGNAVSYTQYAGISVAGAHTYVYGNVVGHCNYYGSDGLGDWDYASIHLEVSAVNSVVDGNRVYDGVNGIETWANEVVITNNYIDDMGATHGEERIVGGRTYKNSAIVVGSNWGSGDFDPTGVTVQGNAVQDNYWGLFYSADLVNGVAAENNWWGDASGPYDPNGLSEVDEPADCSADPADDRNADGLGDEVSAGVDYCPWLNAYARVTLEADAECYGVDDTVSVAVWMRDIPETIVAGQFYLAYDDAILALESVDPGDAAGTDPNNPFETEVYECSPVAGGSNPQCDPVPGLIDYAVGIPAGSTGVAGDVKMAVITFTAAAQICSEQELVTWRPHIPPSRLADNNSNPVYPLLVDLDVVDDQAPVISGLIVTGGDADGNCEYTVTFSATVEDNGCLDPNNVVVDVVLPTGNANFGTPLVNKTPNGSGGIDIDGSVVVSDLTSCPATVQVTVFAVDDCGNAASAAATDPDDGTWSESFAGGGGGSPGNVVHGWDNSEGTQWELSGPTLDSVTLISDTVDADGNGERVYESIYLGGTLMVDAALWGGSGTQTADVVRHTHLTHQVFVGGNVDWATSWTNIVTHAVVPNGPGVTIAGTATFDGQGATPPAGYPPFLGDPSNGGQWGSVSDARLATVGVASGDVTDTTPPPATAPTDVAVECEADVPAGASTYAEFVAAGGTASDNCTAENDLVIAHSDGPLTGGACGGTITRTYTITDECANDFQVQQTITVDDTIAPTFTHPDDITMHADAGGCTLTLALADIGWPSNLNDNCTAVGNLVVSWVRSDGASNLDDPFTGTTTITWRVEDGCGNFETDPLLTVQTISVLDSNELVVSVGLKDVSEPVLSRCITFEVWNCTTGASQSVSEIITFTGGVAANLPIDVPCGAWDCVRARDGLHTLWRTDVDDFGIFGRQYVADLTDRSGFGGDDDALIGGNLFDDVPPYAPPQFIDILDYAVFVNNWAADYGVGDTDCNDVPPHADISGDGTVETGDFTFIQTYFAFMDDPGCCGLFATGEGPRTEISVDELLALGLEELVSADLNFDGWVDEEDVVAFANGARPGVGPADVGPAVLDRVERTTLPTGPSPPPPRGP